MTAGKCHYLSRKQLLGQVRTHFMQPMQAPRRMPAWRCQRNFIFTMAFRGQASAQAQQAVQPFDE